VRVFVLTSGRTGSTTLARACEFVGNYSAGHESLAHEAGEARFAFPDHHIEVDNRLSWFLGQMAERFPDAKYVHLTRDLDEVAESYARRWPESSGWRGLVRNAVRMRRPGASLAAAFGNGLLLRYEPWSKEERLGVCRFMVESIDANIREFLKGRESLSLDLSTLESDFQSLWEWIDAEGDLEGAISVLRQRHNASI